MTKVYGTKLTLPQQILHAEISYVHFKKGGRKGKGKEGREKGEKGKNARQELRTELFTITQ